MGPRHAAGPQGPGIGFGTGADALGAVLVTAALMLAVYTIVRSAADRGGATARRWASAQLRSHCWRLSSCASRARATLIPLRIFRIRNVSGANVVQTLVWSGGYAMFFLGALYLQRVLGYSALEIGLAFMPQTIVVGVLSVGFSERLNTRFDAKATLLPGLVLVGAGLLLWARVPVDGTYGVDVLPAVLLLGLGYGLTFASLLALAMSAATEGDAGLASGLVNTTQQVGGALGLAVLATLSANRTENLLADGDSSAQALTSGYHLAFYVGAGLVAVAIVVAVIVLERVTPAREADDSTEGERALAQAA